MSIFGAELRKTQIQPGNWYTYKRLALILGVTERTLMRWVSAGMVPSPVYSGTSARFESATALVICEGPSLPGMYPVARSLRRAGKVKAIKAIKAKPPTKKGRKK